jgi:hypothetical protein
MGGGSFSGGSASNSGKGALINYFDKTQGSTGASNAINSSGSSNPVTTPGSSGGSGGAGGQPLGTTPGARSDNSSQGFSQNPAARAAVGGNDVLSNVLNKASDMAGSILGTATSPAPTPVLGQRKAWPKLNPEEVIPRLELLRTDAFRFNQGSLPLCTAGAFFFHCFSLKPAETLEFGKTLFGMGQAKLGRLDVRPGSDLRTADYTAIFTNSDLKFAPPQADWMLMCSIRDSTNWWFDFEGAPDEIIATSTSNGNLRDWYEDTGLFSRVEFEEYLLTDSSVAEVKALSKTANNGIAWTVKTKILRSHFPTTDSWVPSRHVIGITSTPVVDEATGKIRFEYWTWGFAPREIEEDLDFVRDCICGIFVVTA